MRSRDRADHADQAGRRWASGSLAFVMLLPVVVVLTAAGIHVDRLVPEITLPVALLLIPVIALLIFVLMVLGAGAWLAVARFIVPRAWAEEFFLAPGLGVFSEVSRWLFERAYGDGSDAR